MTHRVLLIGAVHEALPALAAIVHHPTADLVGVVTLSEDAAASTSGVVDLATPATALGVDVLRVEDVNDAHPVQQIRKLRPDLIVVVGWTRLIGEDLLALPPRGCVGFHASLLPHGRGRAPVNWSILRGETETGNTMMLLNAGVDTGDIVDQRSTPIFLDDTCASVYDRVAQLGAEMLHDQLGSLLSGNVVITAQQGSDHQKFAKRVPDMGVVDWTRPPVEVHNWIRSMTHPYPGAFTEFDGERVMLWGSAPPLMNPLEGVPGEVLMVDESGVRVATRGGSLVVTRVSGPGGETRSAFDWSTDVGLARGSRFSQPTPEFVAWARAEGPRPAELSFLTGGQS